MRGNNEMHAVFENYKDKNPPLKRKSVGFAISGCRPLREVPWNMYII